MKRLLPRFIQVHPTDSWCIVVGRINLSNSRDGIVYGVKQCLELSEGVWHLNPLKPGRNHSLHKSREFSIKFVHIIIYEHIQTDVDRYIQTRTKIVNSHDMI